MAVFELVIALLFGGALLSAGARRVKVPYPALLALAGAGLALVPNAPTLVLDRASAEARSWSGSPPPSSPPMR